MSVGMLQIKKKRRKKKARETKKERNKTKKANISDIKNVTQNGCFI